MSNSLKRIYVRYQAEEHERIKLIKLSDKDELNFQSLSSKIVTKFSLPSDAHYAFEGKVEKDGPFVELDDQDDDILDDVIEVKFGKVEVECEGGVAEVATSRIPQQVPLEWLIPEEQQQRHPNAQDDVGNASESPPYAGPYSLPDADQEVLDFDVRGILERHAKGRGVLGEYNSKGYLSPAARMSLVSILVRELVSRCGNYPTRQEKHALGRAIITGFPNLRDPAGATGYEHFFRCDGTQGGYIQDRLKNQRRTLPEAAKMKTPTRANRVMSGMRARNGHGQSNACTNKATSQISQREFPGMISVEDAEEMETICRNSASDGNSDVVMNAMSKHAVNRRFWIETERPELEEIFERYPCFLDLPELINQDFQCMFAGSEDSLKQGWIHHAGMILTHNVSGQHENIIKTSNDYALLDKTERAREDVTALYGFLMLTRLLPSHNTKGKGRVKCDDVSDYLIKFYPDNTSLSICLEEEDSSKQLLLLALGTKTSITKIFMKLGNHLLLLPTSNVTSAVDLLFKSHYVFNLDYTAPLTNFFVYLQLHLYSLNHNGKVPSRVTELALALRADRNNLST